jgi:beta-glucosidase
MNKKNISLFLLLLVTAFCSVKSNVAAGKISQVTITLPPLAFEFFDEAAYGMAITPEEYEVMYDSSSDAKDLKMTKILIQ